MIVSGSFYNAEDKRKQHFCAELLNSATSSISNIGLLLVGSCLF